MPDSISRSPTETVTHDDPHLQAARDTKGHRVQTPDGRCGHIEDWLVDIDSWTTAEAVIENRNWWPGDLVRIPCAEITNVDWIDKSVYVRLSKEEIEHLPRYGVARE